MREYAKRDLLPTEQVEHAWASTTRNNTKQREDRWCCPCHDGMRLFTKFVYPWIYAL